MSVSSEIQNIRHAVSLTDKFDINPVVKVFTFEYTIFNSIERALKKREREFSFGLVGAHIPIEAHDYVIKYISKRIPL